jgi:hypothetical protein
MKFNMSLMDLIKHFMLIVSVVTMSAGVAYSAGWIVNRAGASEMIAQSVYGEALDRERADLQFQIDMASMKLQLLSEKEQRTDYDELEMSLLTDQIKRLQQRLEELNMPQGAG